MSDNDPVKKEIADKALKLRNAQEAVHRPEASERDQADLKLIEQDLLAEKMKARRGAAHKGSGSPSPPASLKDRMEKKLDAALKESFPGSDPVSFVEAAPVNEGDRDLTAVKINDGPGGTGPKPKSK